VTKILLLRCGFFYASADLHNCYIALILKIVGEFSIFFEKNYCSLVLAQEEVALGFGEYEFIIILKVSSMAKGRKTIFISTVLEQKISCILVNLLIFGSECDISLKI
jgi:hypothetical protein